MPQRAATDFAGWLCLGCAVLLGLAVPACFSPDYGPEPFLCNTAQRCPSGYQCYNGLCGQHAPFGREAGPADADRAVPDLSLADRLRPDFSSVVAGSVEDFSGVQGQKGWFYGYYDATANGKTYAPTKFTRMMLAGGRWWADQTKYWTDLTTDGGHPNGERTSGGKVAVEQWAVRRWTSDRNGKVLISALLRRADLAQNGGDGTTGAIYVDGKLVWSASVTPASEETKQATAARCVAVSQGSPVDFAITPGPNSVDGGDATVFRASLTTDASCH